jgi:hypothetical protein
MDEVATIPSLSARERIEEMKRLTNINNVSKVIDDDDISNQCTFEQK